MSDLFSNFPEISSKQWKQKIQVDLKGADYNKTLIWDSPEGISVKPFYHPDENKTTNKSATSFTFQNCQSIYVTNGIDANQKALTALTKGADSIQFIIENEDISVESLLQNLNLEEHKIFFQLHFLDSGFISKIVAVKSNAGIYLNIDIIGNLARSGNWYHTLKKDHEILEDIVSKQSNFKSVLSVDLSLYQNAGANMVQQLAYSMAQVNEYLNHFNNKIKKPILFHVSIGSNYFFEIAKLRAIRALYNTLVKEYNGPEECHIFAFPTKRNKTIYDYNTNMLRTTTECMSAILGSTNTICNMPYDAIYHKTNEFAERISRNQLLILKHESYFDQVINPSDGAYYIESITSELAEKALLLFKDIEANGGFLKQLKDGTIQRKIKESATKEQELFNSGKEVLIGTNKYPNAKDKMKDELELYPFVKTNKRKTLIEPIIEKRLAEAIEQERLNNE